MFYYCLLIVVTVSSLASSYNVISDDVHASALHLLKSNRSKRQTELTTSGVIIQEGKCVIPPHPDNGAYTANVNGSTVPGDVYLYVYINVTCDPGFIPEKQFFYCFDGFWSDSMPQCVRFCHLKKHVSVQYQCLTPGVGLGSRVCGPIEPKGTIVKPVCNAPDFYYPGTLDYMTCDGQEWNYVAVCTMVSECGKVTPPDLLLVIGGDTAYKGELPWHVGIYMKGIRYRQICGGSLVSVTTVITAAHCFWSDRKKLLPASLFAVAAGKIHRKWNDTRDSDAQKSDILDIKVSPYFQGAATNYQNDIAVVVVATPFVFRASVRPVCVDFDEGFNNEQLNGSTLGKVGGWGLTSKNGQPSHVLKTVDLPYVSVGECFQLVPQSFKEFITSDKMCAGYTNGTALCQGDSGGGLAFPATRRGVLRYYLRGIVSTAPKNADLCSANSLTTFTALIEHEVFVRKYIYVSSVRGNNTCSESEWKCRDGTCISMARKCDNIIDCHDGSDETDPECDGDETKRQKGFCSLQEDESVEYRCFAPTLGPCGTLLAPGTVVIPECKSPNYYSPSSLRNMTCINGYWDYIAKCKPDCGRPTPRGMTLMANGRDAERGELPWHAGIYWRSDLPYLPYIHTCGATLVTTTAVISAAHCFWIGRKTAPPSDFSVAVGKIHRDWDDDGDADAQKSNVATITIPERFKSTVTNYHSDIAVVTVVTPFVYKTYVRPICLDFDRNFHKTQIQENNLGKISGWGMTGNKGDFSNILKVAEMPYVSTQSCIAKTAPGFRKYITGDKFCAGYENGTAVCQDDGGGGLVFPSSDRGQIRYYLRGVLSTSQPDDTLCNLNTVALYTDIVQHEIFIKDCLPPLFNDYNDSILK